MTRRRFPKLKPDKLESKVAMFKISEDTKGEYIPYCNFHCHKGIVLDEFVCDSRGCRYYRKAYLGNPVYTRESECK